jgi:hypothetical protein
MDNGPKSTLQITHLHTFTGFGIAGITARDPGKAGDTGIGSAGIAITGFVDAGVEAGLVAAYSPCTTTYIVHLAVLQVCNGCLVQDQPFLELLCFHNTLLY